ncbi:rubrerythrin [Candidatus Magnetoovum chiemensis]|nr:rubrerythrin [Candidatus Magnetoovum chiemensis]
MDKSKKVRAKELDEMIQVVLLAIPREISARDFYLNAVSKATSDSSRTLFYNLAEQEKGHEVWLRKILDELRSEVHRECGSAIVGAFDEMRSEVHRECRLRNASATGMGLGGAERRAGRLSYLFLILLV